MSTAYVPADTIDEIREAMRAGASRESLAIRIGIDPEDLANLLGEPIWRTIPAEPAGDEFDLWRADELQAQL